MDRIKEIFTFIFVLAIAFTMYCMINMLIDRHENKKLFSDVDKYYNVVKDSSMIVNREAIDTLRTKSLIPVSTYDKYKH